MITLCGWRGSEKSATRACEGSMETREKEEMALVERMYLYRS